MSRPFIEVTDVSKTFATGQTTRHVLRDVCLSVARGEFVSIIGAMGSGKSTLLAIIAGLLAPDAGRVAIDGATLTGVRPDTSVVFQNYSLLPWLTAMENVRLAIGSTWPDMGRTDQRARAQQVLEMVGLGHALHRKPAQLSGGMRQRVAIARALSTDPGVLLLDDPFGALDAMTRDTLQQELVRLGSSAARPVTTVMITNSVDEAILLSDRIVPMLPGPPATLGEPIAVDLPRPRSADMLQHDERASWVRADVVAALTAAMAHRRPSQLLNRAPVDAPRAEARA
ncbi:MAG: ABC transporter ATP-binding protein [Acidobacteria bacterium]|nr:ABC transporter ATP-binding protein [Acidobacteriota bacterium]